jgi:hypothetical protein
LRNLPFAFSRNSRPPGKPGSLGQLKFLKPAMQSAPADPQFFCGLGAVAAAFLQGSHNQADFIVMDVDEILVSHFAEGKTARCALHGQGKFEGQLVDGSGEAERHVIAVVRRARRRNGRGLAAAPSYAQRFESIGATG